MNLHAMFAPVYTHNANYYKHKSAYYGEKARNKQNPRWIERDSVEFNIPIFNIKGNGDAIQT